MAVAIDDRPEQERSEPAGLALHDGDYVYAEYLDNTCLDDDHAFIHSTLACKSAPFSVENSDVSPRLDEDGGGRRRSNEQRERARILQFFSPGA